MLDDSKRYDEIASAVCGIYEDYAVSKVPIDIRTIAVKMGFILHSYSEYTEHEKQIMTKVSDDGFCSFLSQYGKFGIFYNDSVDKERTRFTIAHEIGHIVLQHTERNDTRIDEEANYFARCLLAPPVLLILKNVKSIEEVRNMFDISYQCAVNSFEAYKHRVKFYGKKLMGYEMGVKEMFYGS